MCYKLTVKCIRNCQSDQKSTENHPVCKAESLSQLVSHNCLKQQPNSYSKWAWIERLPSLMALLLSFVCSLKLLFCMLFLEIPLGVVDTTWFLKYTGRSTCNPRTLVQLAIMPVNINMQIFIGKVSSLSWIWSLSLDTFGLIPRMHICNNICWSHLLE